MPVFGGKNPYLRKSPHGKRLGLVIERKIRDNEVKRTYRREIGEWRVFDSPLSRINANLGIDIPAWIERNHESGKTVRVLDWGCGRGVALRELNRLLGGKIKTYGYDYRSYRAWNTREPTRYVQEEPEKMLRYFKPRTLDLIISHHGVYHYLREKSIDYRANYLAQLAQRLRERGMLISNFNRTPAIPDTVQKLRDLLGSAYRVETFIPSTTRKPIIQITRLS